MLGDFQDLLNIEAQCTQDDLKETHCDELKLTFEHREKILKTSE